MTTAINSRKMLWLGTIHQCVQLLQLAARAESSATTPAAVEAAVLGDAAPFGHAVDCHATHKAARMLAIAVFCQLTKHGRQDGAVVAANPMQDHWHATVKATFPGPGEAAAFTAFYAQLVDVRDNALGHANGAWFDVEHSPTMSKFKMHEAALQGVDFGYFLDCALRLRATLLAGDGAP